MTHTLDLEQLATVTGGLMMPPHDEDPEAKRQLADSIRYRIANGLELYPKQQGGGAP